MATPVEEMPLNNFKRGLLARRPQIGLWSSLANNISVEIIAGSGFDWILLDTEHVPNEPPMVLSQLQAMTGGTATPIVRVAWNDAVMVKRQLDMGVQTFLIPFVQNAKEARQAVASTRFPKFEGGVRGFAAASRANKFGRVTNYHQRAHEEMCVLVQVETRAALKEIEAIAAVDGVDGIFIGPGDLSSDMGHLGNLSHPEVLEAIAQAIGRINKTGKAAGILAPVEAEARRWLEMGALFVAVGSDVGLLARGSEALAAKFKSPAPGGRATP
ncbi:MAG TPA: HpcH/HpaI aldolase/citrate lyase family protein [Opitutaceae bacterium]|nr:HpcH/HpaI aldolase/citrate lyase family protein [Opitutaceae bacterium]